MTISIPEKPNLSQISVAVKTLKSHSFDPQKIITKDILLKSNFDQFLFLIGIASYEGKEFNLNLNHIKFYINNVVKNNINILLKLEIVLHKIFLKKYESENTYNKFYNYISSLYKIKRNKKNKFTKISSILFYVPSPVLLAHTNPLFFMLKNRKNLSVQIVIASRGRNKNFEEKCLQTNVKYENIERNTDLETIDNLANLSKNFDVTIWQSLPAHLSYFRTLNQNVCLWSHKFHPDIPDLLDYIGSFNDRKNRIYINNNFWKNLDVGFEIRNKNQKFKNWKERRLKFGSFCREELINDEFFWKAVKTIIQENQGSKFYYCGKKPIHDKWCRELQIKKNNIVFLGWLDEPHLKLKDMSFLIDGFSLGHGYMALEAMAASIPIIFPKNRKAYGTLENYLEKTINLFNVTNKKEYRDKYLISFSNEDQLINYSKKLFNEQEFNNFYGLHYASIISKLRNDNFEKFVEIITEK